MKEQFRRLSHAISGYVGTPAAFAIAVMGIILWAMLGPFFEYSDTWQLVINTSTTIITFLMVFIIQNSQNRDGRAIHLKLDELIRAIPKARNHLIDLENLTEEALDILHLEFCETQKVTEQKIKDIRKVKEIKKENGS